MRTVQRVVPDSSTVRNRYIFFGSTADAVRNILDKNDISIPVDAFGHISGSILSLFGLFRTISSKGECLVLHGIPHRDVWFAMLPFRRLRRHTFWLVWGAGVNGPLRYSRRRKTALVRIWMAVYGVCVRSLGAVSCQNETERRALESLIGAKLKTHFWARYLLPDPPADRAIRSSKLPLCVLTGQSGHPGSNYEETFTKLEKFSGEEMQVHAPLVYGEADYIAKVCDLGKEKFGDRFVALLRRKPFDEYVQYLRSIDVVMFNHSSPGGAGGFNLVSCLSLGAKVFLREDNGYFELLKGHGAHIFTFNDLSGMDWEEFSRPLSESAQIKNWQVIELLRQTVITDWPKVYQAICA